MEKVSVQKSASGNFSKFFKKERSSVIFYSVMLALPIIQVLIFYVYVNINSIMMAFQKYDLEKGFYFVGLENFASIKQLWMTNDTLQVSLKNTMITFGLTIVIELFALVFSFYIYKKMTGSFVFKSILFFPSIVSSAVLAIIYTNIFDVVLPQIQLDLFGREVQGILSKESTRFLGNLFYYFLFAFGMRIIIYSNSMSQIPESVSEAAKLDGATSLDEFIKITLPMIASSISTFIIAIFASFLTNGLGTYAIYNLSAPNNVYTIGYYLSAETMKTSGIQSGYPYLAAFGILLSAITIPLVFFIRWLFGQIVDMNLEY